ncbi:hypothetical protein [Hoeflea sp. TYP-13]|uniref:hypothetical protein n=1 Tax=Hoeflea sp. TYP-13 TaxID=3230023 RepID=UPI0034C6BC0E
MRPYFLPVPVCALCISAGFADVATAGSKYDRKIEQAAIEIVSQKLGDIRGSHEIHEPYYLYPPVEARSAADGTLKPASRSDHPLYTVNFDGS